MQIRFVERVKPAWSDNFSWQHGKESARELPATPVTVARDDDASVLPDTPVQSLAASANPQGGILTFFREQFPKELEHLISDMYP